MSYATLIFLVFLTSCHSGGSQTGQATVADSGANDDDADILDFVRQDLAQRFVGDTVAADSAFDSAGDNCILDATGPGPRCVAASKAGFVSGLLIGPMTVTCTAGQTCVAEAAAWCGTNELGCLRNASLDGVHFSGNIQFSISFGEPALSGEDWLAPGDYQYSANFQVGGADGKPALFQVRFAPNEPGKYQAEVTFGGHFDEQLCDGVTCIQRNEAIALKITGIATASAPADATSTKD